MVGTRADTSKDIDTLASDFSLRAHESLSWRSIVGWSLAAVMAIILGVVPALWINRWRTEAAAPTHAEAPTAVETEALADELALDDTPTPVETAPPRALPPTVPAPAATVAAPARRVAAKPATKQTKSRPRPATTRPGTRPGKRERGAPPPCDIYLHPHGCPR